MKIKKLIRIALAQFNPIVGDLYHNTQKIIDIAKQARRKFKARIIVFPELAITGYSPEDYLLRNDFCEDTLMYLDKIKNETEDFYIILGHPIKNQQGLFNAASVLHNKSILCQYYKHHLPNTGEFDEKRYFKESEGNPTVFLVDSLPIGNLICEDLWRADLLKRTVDKGAKIVISLNASPFYATKTLLREKTLINRQQTEGKVPLIYVNLVGGQDELVFDGNSFMLTEEGQVCYCAPAFKESLETIDVTVSASGNIADIKPSNIFSPPKELESIYQALVLGIKDYVFKNNLEGALLGLSGGIDSALSAAIAVDALGPDRVLAV